MNGDPVPCKAIKTPAGVEMLWVKKGREGAEFLTTKVIRGFRPFKTPSSVHQRGSGFVAQEPQDSAVRRCHLAGGILPFQGTLHHGLFGAVVDQKDYGSGGVD
jgi:hypothetical protein